MADAEKRFIPGNLWEKITQKSAEALAIGAQKPIETSGTIIEDSGVHFIVRKVSSLALKANEKSIHNIDVDGRQGGKSASTKNPNPFLPYDQALYVCDVSATHVCLLNKFNVIDNHVLLVTKAFEHQETLLTESDFAALYACMREYNSLGFYNGGVVAGASQEHKHLQLIPLPFASQMAHEFPLSPLFEIAKPCRNRATQIPLPFSHAVMSLDDLRGQTIDFAAAYLLDCYRQLLTFVGIKADEYRQGKPYNLLLTKQWMWLVPRSRELFDSISINSLGFAGSLFVRDDKQLKLLCNTGPMQVLQSVAD